MKAKILFLASIFAIVGCATGSKKGSGFQLRDFQEKSLSNGLRVIYLEDKSLPYFSMDLLIPVGSKHDPLEHSGLANLVASLLKKGTKNRTAIKIAEDLDFIAADFSANAGRDFTVMSASTLSFHQEKLLDLFSELVLSPSFQKVEIDRLKKNILAQTERIPDNPRGFIGRAMNKYMYGDGHPYAHPVGGTLSGVKAIQKKDVNRFYLKRFRPTQSILTVVGNFDKGIKTKIEAKFASWQARELKKDEMLKFPPIEKAQHLLVHKKGLVQAQVRFGLRGIRRDNPDYMAIRLANTILGGAFASRLNDQIRDNLGLTYGIWSGFRAKKSEGTFVVSSFTRNEKVPTMINEINKILKTFHENGVTEAEVNSAKGLMKGKFPRSIETAERLAYNLTVLRFYGLPDSYLSDFISTIDGLSVSQVNSAIKKYFDPKNYKLLIFGDKRKLSKGMQGLGDFKTDEFETYL